MGFQETIAKMLRQKHSPLAGRNIFGHYGYYGFMLNQSPSNSQNKFDALIEAAISLGIQFKESELISLDCDLGSIFENEDDSEQKKTSIIVVDDALRVGRIIKSIATDNEELFKIRPRDFELIVAELLKNKGFEVEITKQTRDGGYDLMAIHDSNGFKNKYLVECKRFSPNRPVGIEVVRSFMDVIQREYANKGIICTTSYFTSSIIDEKKHLIPYKLELKDRLNLLEWIEDYAINYRSQIAIKKN